MRLGILIIAAGGLLAAACAPSHDAVGPQWNTLSGDAPLIIAHRGASGDRPEHTLEAYQLAIEQGADIIEPDLVMTSDGVLVARHDRWLSDSTDVADRPEFADRRREEDGRSDWWADDFTLAELRSLRARQVFPGRSTEFDDQFLIPTFEEILDLALAAGVPTEPEVKSPAALAARGLDPLPELVRILRERGLDGADAPIAIQCFEPDFLARLDGQVDAPLLMLVYALEDGSPSVSLAQMSGFADGIGPQKTLLIDETGADTGYLAAAHAAGLAVHPWTFRADQPAPDGADFEAELRRMLALGADAVFTDHPGLAVEIRDAMAARETP